MALTQSELRLNIVSDIFEILGGREPRTIERQTVLTCCEYILPKIKEIRFLFYSCIYHADDNHVTTHPGASFSTLRRGIRCLKIVLNSEALDINIATKRIRKRINGKKIDVTPFNLSEMSQKSRLPDRMLLKHKLNDDEKKQLAVLRNVIPTTIRARHTEPHKYIKTLGCTNKAFCEYIEGMFVDGMTWDNYGQAHGKWVVDHIIPVSRFKEFEGLQLHDMFLFPNCQPLWVCQNQVKSNRIAEVKNINDIYDEIVKLKQSIPVSTCTISPEQVIHYLKNVVKPDDVSREFDSVIAYLESFS